jgi:cysteine desulfuration protein SufE
MIDAQQYPFGKEVTVDDMVDTLGFFDSWEDRYRHIIDMGKQLPPLDDEQKSDNLKVKGCQSQVWIQPQPQQDKLYFAVESDAHIVSGLLALVLCAYNGQSAKQILDFDIEGYFSQLDLLQHLSPIRGNGLRSMVKRIQSYATEALSDA